MEDQQLHNQIKQVYQEINNRWMRFHMRLLVLCALCGAIAEVLMFFVIYYSNILTYTVTQYWCKYIIIPSSLIFLVTIIAFFIMQNKNFSVNFKQYGVSFSFALLAFILSFMHSGFVAVLSCSIFPVIMTIMYENQRLTILTASLSIFSQLISGTLIFWDPDKVLNSTYYINMFILILTTICALLACNFMIKFMKLKKDIIITNDIERYHLQEKVNMDGLTQVGNKLALMNQLENTAANANRLHYLAMIDIDDFKKINDSYGHIFGDDVLKCVGVGMRNIKANASAYRYGGDEFSILFFEPSLNTVIDEIKSVQEHLKLTMKSQDNSCDIMLSVGISCYSTDKSTTALLQQADEAMYQSKKTQAGCIIVFEDKDK